MDINNSLDVFIKSLDPNQKDFIPQSPLTFDLQKANNKETKLVKTITNTPKSLFAHWKFSHKLSDGEINGLDIIMNGKKNSLYMSLIQLLYPDYSVTYTYSQKIAICENFIRSIISKMEIDTKIKLFMRDLKFKQNSLIDEIKNETYQSDVVLYYISLVLDINIIVLSSANDIEVYYSEDKYDNCKPHILLYRDNNYLFHSIITIGKESHLLNYHDHVIIKKLMDNHNKKIYCKKTYLKLSLKSK